MKSAAPSDRRVRGFPQTTFRKIYCLVCPFRKALFFRGLSRPLLCSRQSLFANYPVCAFIFSLGRHICIRANCLVMESMEWQTLKFCNILAEWRNTGISNNLYVAVIASEAKQSHLPKFKQQFRWLRFARNDEEKHLKVNMNITSIRLKCYKIPNYGNRFRQLRKGNHHFPVVHWNVFPDRKVT